MARRSRLAQHSTKWWTRERVLLGLRRCYEDFKQLPTNSDDYHALTQFTGETRNGRPSHLGWHRRYPSYGPISNYFGGMREAWNAVSNLWPELNLVVDRGYQDWSPEEDWFIKESVGVIPRAEVSRLMRRTEPAIKRRLYDLNEGNCYSIWGWTINHVSRVLKVSREEILKYIRRGELLFFQGNKCIYIDPADLLLIREYNWQKKHHPKELDQAVRAALMKRLCFVLLGHDWRQYRYHQVQPVKNFRTGAPYAAISSQTPPPTRPENIKPGNWVRVLTESQHRNMVGRIGQVVTISWRSESIPAKGKGTPPCWMATVEFRKCLPRERPEQKTILYSIRIDSLAKTRKPRSMKQPRLLPGTWVRVTKGHEYRSVLRRVGQVRSLHWHSPHRPRTGSAAPPPCWMAQVEFPKGKPLGSPKVKGVTYSVPIALLTKVPRPDWSIPGDLKVGCWARVTRDLPCYGSKDRIGKVVSLQFRAKDRRDARRGKSSWVAAMVFTKHRRYQRQSKQTIRFCVPVVYLEKVRKPYSRRPTAPRTKAPHLVTTRRVVHSMPSSRAA